MGAPTIPSIDQTKADFEATYQDHFVLPKNNYDTAGNAIGAIPSSMIPQHPTAEYGNTVDGMVRAFQQRLSKLWVNVIEHGALADGVTDDSPAIQAALTAAAAAGGGTVWLPPGVYFCNEPLVVPSTVHLLGAGRETHLLFTGSTGTFSDGACVVCKGSLTLLPTINIAVAKGATTIAFQTDPTLEAGDVFAIYDTDDFSFHPERAYYRAGEFFRVVSRTGPSVEVDAPAFDAYTTGVNIECHKLTPTYGSIRGIRVSGRNTSTEACILIRHGDGFALDSIWTDSSQLSGISLDRCFETTLRRFTHFDHGTAAGLNYGLAIVNSQRVEATQMYLSATRHGLSTGGASVDAGVPNRQVRVTHTQCYSTENYSGDMHGNTEHCEYAHCTFGAGLSWSGDFNRLIDCTIFAENNSLATDSFGLIGNDGLLGWSHTIKGCRFYATADQPDADGQLLALTGTEANLSRGGELLIEDNTFDARGYKHRIALIVHSSTTITDANFYISRNKVKQLDESTIAQDFTRDFQVGSSSDCWIESYDIFQNLLDGGNIRVAGGLASSGRISQNKIIAPGNYGIRVTGPGASFISSKPLLEIQDNTLRSTNRGGVIVDTWGSFELICRINKNSVTRGAQYGAGHRYGVIVENVGSGFVEVIDNLLEMSGPAAQGALRFSTVGTLVERGNFIPAGSVVISKTGVTTEISEHIREGNIRRIVGSGSPEGVHVAPVGSTFHRTDGGSGTSFYVKESGSSNTGWSSVS